MKRKSDSFTELCKKHTNNLYQLSPILFSLALQKVIQSIKTFPSDIKIDQQQLNVLPFADDIVLIVKMK
jgi:hypothetical protein